jgi:Ras-related protein Rab-35
MINLLTLFFFHLVGNKDDMPDRKVVLTEDAQRFASQMGIQLFETSAKDNKNVEEMFNAITQQVLLTKKEQKEQASNANDTITVGKGRKPTKKSKCC